MLAIGCGPKDDGWAFKLARGLMKSMDTDLNPLQTTWIIVTLRSGSGCSGPNHRDRGEQGKLCAEFQIAINPPRKTDKLLSLCINLTSSR